MLTSLFRPSLALLLSAAALGTLAGPAAAQSADIDRLSIHGFLTQAYGISDGRQVLGIPSYGTADYRIAALQFRYDATDRDVVLVQLSQERLGRSPLARHEPEVDLDWVFYQHRFGENTIARVGKVRSPIGIYNEIRDVGTLLPLYRPPTSHYGELTYTNETVDGIMLGHRVSLGAWDVDLDGFFGSWEYLQNDGETFTKVDTGLGLQAWVHTPVQGLRVGAAAVRYDARNIVDDDPDLADDEFLWLVSVDGTFARFFVRGESYRVTFGEEEAGYSGGSGAHYGQVGYQVTGAVSLVAQAEFLDFELDLEGPFPLSFDGQLERDLALGLRFQPSPSLAVKLEAHQYRGFLVEDRDLSIFSGAPLTATYGLLSVSTSF